MRFEEAKRAARFVVLGAALAVLPACGGTRMIGSGPHAYGEAAPEGIRYHLPKTLVEVGVRTTLTSRRSVSYEKNDAGLYEFKVKSLPFDVEQSAATVTVLHVPDTREFYALHLEPGRTSDDSLTVETYGSGLLASINMESTGQEGQVLADTLEAAATIAGFLVGLADRGTEAARTFVCGKLRADPSAAKFPCEDLEGLPMQTLYFLGANAEGRKLFLRGHELDAITSERRKTKREIEDKIGPADAKELAALESKRALLDASLRAALEERKEVSTAFEARLQAFAEEQRFAPESITRDVVRVFEVAEIPDEATLPEGTKSADVPAKLANHPAMLELWNATRIAIALTPDRGAPPKTPKSVAPAEEEEAEGRVFYRPSRAATLRLLSQGKIADPDEGRIGESYEGIRIVDARRIDVMDPREPPATISFDPAAFAKRRLALGFDTKGRLVRLEQSSASTFPSASGAVADGLASASSALGVASVVDIAAKEPDLSTVDTLVQIERLRRQRQTLDAQIQTLEAVKGIERTRPLERPAQPR
ncbi:hypothetical protein [Polyangium sp. y55x31]|uniref:hypothetical protein n=1 Tax=Polyangium sp. y55x31 TaxID=3042688 RepID=UPI0024831ED2|nr:hypothetical protein [Polyangium sp. y55x31]MDI1483676.1 hypothetical protein [Polyangium sp. y55x31]